MKVLAAARHPGPAEAVGMVVAELRGQGHDVLLIGVRNDTMDTKVHGGSAHIFQRLGLTFLDLIDAGYIGDVVNIPITFADSLIESYRPDVIFVGCSLDVNGEHMGIEETLVQAGQTAPSRPCRWSSTGMSGILGWSLRSPASTRRWMT